MAAEMAVETMAQEEIQVTDRQESVQEDLALAKDRQLATVLKEELTVTVRRERHMVTVLKEELTESVRREELMESAAREGHTASVLKEDHTAMLAVTEETLEEQTTTTSVTRMRAELQR